MIKYWNITIPELSGSMKRRAYVYVPAQAKRHPECTYPVLYMFDGHNLFFDDHATYGKSWGLKAYLEHTHMPLIVAAVECHHGCHNERLNEYSPFPFSERRWGTFEGKGDVTMQWLIKAFKPYIDAHYPTRPEREHTFIGGSSMGGLMSLYAVTAYNGVFSRALAMSPSLWDQPRMFEDLIKRTAFTDPSLIYMDLGSLEGNYKGDNKKRLFRFASLYSEKGVSVTARIIPGGTHCEASWERQLPAAFEALFYDYSFDESRQEDN